MLTTDYRDSVTYWGAPTIDGWGNKSFSAPVILSCRWENRAERFIDMFGAEAVSRAVVWVPQVVDLGGYIYRGESEAGDPTEVTGAYIIRMLFEIPDLRNMFVERRVFL